MIELREIREKEQIRASEILAESFADKFRVALGKDDEKNKIFIVDAISYFWKEKNIHDIWAFEDGVLLWVISLKWISEEKKMNHWMKFSDFRKKYGLWKILKFIWLAMLLDHVVKKDECYIDNVAVSEQARGKGVGTKLLEAWEDWAREWNKKIYSLFVADSNRAKELYERKGFVTKKKESSHITKYLFGRKDWLYMEKELI